MDLKKNWWKILTALVAGVIIYMLIIGPPEKWDNPPNKTPETESFTLLYTSNMQGKILPSSQNEAVAGITPADYTRVYMNLARLKAEAENRQEPVLIVDLGDSLAGDEDISRNMGGWPMEKLMNEAPYSCILMRECEYALGDAALKKLPRRIAFLDYGVEYAKGRKDAGKTPPYIKSHVILKAGDLKVAVFGYRSKGGRISRKMGKSKGFMFDPFLPRNDEKIFGFKRLVSKTKADCKIVLTGKNLRIDIPDDVDVMIPAPYPSAVLIHSGKRNRDGIFIPPPVDSRFHIGKLRFVRKKGTRKWQIYSSVEKIMPYSDTPPGSVLNVVLEAKHNTEIKYKGRYQQLYEAFTTWAPDGMTRKEWAKVIGRSILSYRRFMHFGGLSDEGLGNAAGIDSSVIDKSDLKMPSCNVLGVSDILGFLGDAFPGLSESTQPKLLELERINSILYTDIHRPGMSRGRTIIAPISLLLKHKAVLTDKIIKLPVPISFFVLDFFRYNRSYVFKTAEADKTLVAIASFIDKWRFKKAIKYKLDPKGLKPMVLRDAYMLKGLAAFKSGSLDNAIKFWKKAKKIDPKNPGINRILQIATGETKAKLKKPVLKKNAPQWPSFHGSPQNAGVAAVKGPGRSLLKWKLDTDSKIIGSVAIGWDGTAYFGAEDFHIYAVDSAGRLKWKYKTGLPVRSTPAIGRDGTVYVGSDDRRLYALTPKGRLKWKIKGGHFFSSSPVIAPDGIIYIGCEDGRLYAVTPKGKVKWKFKTNALIHSSPAIAPDGTVYVGSEDHFLYAINPDGKMKWKFETKHKVNSSPCVGPDGAVYVGSEDRNLYAVNPDGKLRWKAPTGNYITSSPAAGKDGTIFVGSEDKHIYAFDKKGKLKWKFKTRGEIISSPVVDAAGRVFCGSDGGSFYALKPDGKLLWKFSARDPVMSSAAFMTDGTVVIGSEDGNVYALGP